VAVVGETEIVGVEMGVVLEVEKDEGFLDIHKIMRTMMAMIIMIHKTAWPLNVLANICFFIVNPLTYLNTL